MKQNWIVIVAVAMGLTVVSTPAVLAEESMADRTGIMEVLRDVQIEMAAISEHAAKLQQMVERPGLYSLSTYDFEWTSIKGRFNKVGELVPKLHEAPDVKAWQNEMLGELPSLVTAMDVQIEKGMKHLNDAVSAERLHADEAYEIRIDSVRHYAQHIDELIESIESKSKNEKAS